jgi:GTP cyclohydrolase II
MAADLPDAAIRTQVRIPLRFSDGYTTTVLVTSFRGLVDNREHLALACGSPPAVPLVRPHSECLYLRQEGRGIGLYDKLDAYALQDTGLDTYEANVALGHAPDERDYTVAAQMLRALGVSTLALLSNNPDKAAQLERLGVTVAARVPTAVHLSEANASYLSTKARNGHHGLGSVHLAEVD